MVEDLPYIIDYFSYCTEDCEGGHHVGEWIECDRCGSPTHVKVFVVDHPKWGVIKVGRECFKDVMGFNFTKSHERALETQEEIFRWIDDLPVELLGEVIAVGLSSPSSGRKNIPVEIITRRSDGFLKSLSSFRFENSLRKARYPLHPPAPYGWSKSIINAGLDLGLWDTETNLDLPTYFDKPLIMEIPEEEIEENPINWRLESALDELSGPIRIWVHRPETEGKKSLLEAYEGLTTECRKALDKDVERVIQEIHGGSTFIAYRRSPEKKFVLRGLDSVSTDPGFVGYLDPEWWREYEIDASDVLVHWGQDTPLGSSQYKHEKEVILKPGVVIYPIDASFETFIHPRKK